jgi:hypothetical protein
MFTRDSSRVLHIPAARNHLRPTRRSLLLGGVLLPQDIGGNQASGLSHEASLHSFLNLS